MKLIEKNLNSFPLRKQNSKTLYTKYVSEHNFEIIDLNSNEILATTNLWSCTGLIIISKHRISLFHIVNINDLDQKLQPLIKKHLENSKSVA